MYTARKRLVLEGPIDCRARPRSGLPTGQLACVLQAQRRSVNPFTLLFFTLLNSSAANGIPIEGWTHDPSDEALLDLLPVLDSLRFTSDVRRVLGIRGFSA